MEQAYYYPKVPHPDILLLTQSEWEVLLHMSNGLNAKEMAVIGHVMPKSIDNCKNRIGKKLGLQGYGSLARFALENRIVLLEWSRVLHPEKDNRCSLKPINMVSMNSMDMENISGGRTTPCDSKDGFNARAILLPDLGNQRMKLFNTAI